MSAGAVAGRGLLAGGVALAVAQGAPGLTALAPVRRLFPGLAGAGAADHVALTFDDGPDPGFTPRFLATLAGRGVRATFFLLGPMVQAAPRLAAEIAAAGHEIGVHGWDHRYATLRGPGALHDDLARACDTIAAATGTVPRLYRPPYGVLSASALIAAHRLGLRPVLWSTWGREWAPGATPGTVRATLAATLARRGNGAAARFRLHRPGGQGRGGPGCAALAAGRVRRPRAAGGPARRASGGVCVSPHGSGEVKASVCGK